MEIIDRDLLYEMHVYCQTGIELSKELEESKERLE